MTNKSTKRTLLTSVLSLFLCFTMLVGTTFAWFTDSASSANNVIQAGNLDVEMYWAEGVEDPATLTWNKIEGQAIFNNDKWEPGYVEAKHIKIANEGSLAFKWRLLIVPSGEVQELADVIDVYYVEGATQLTREILASATPVCTLRELINDVDGAAHGALLPEGETATDEYERVSEVTATLAFKMRDDVDNYYQGMSIGTDFSLQLMATQYAYESDSFDNQYDANAEPDHWDGTADTSWYNDTDTTFTLATAEQFAGFAALVSEDVNNFEGKTILLDRDIDLGGKGNIGDSFAPIGYTGERDGSGRLIVEPFKGTFDGNGHTISNIQQSGWDFGYEWGQYGSIGLFSELEGATVKNVVLEGFDCAVEGGDVSFIAGSATGDCTFENITINSGSIGTYNNGIGGIIGWSGAGTYNFKDITIGEDVVIGGLWGSFDSSAGGVVGQAEPGATYNFENVTVACRMDVYNDCTASYDYYNYRMCGMLIGRLEETTTIDGVNYPDVSKYNITCKNVTVIYGEWANYHYCEPTPGLNGGRGMRVEPGYAYDGLPADFDHTQCVDNHMLLLPFDQIFGGDQIGVKGLKEYDGVTVIYNNK